MRPFDVAVLAARVSLDLWADAVSWSANDDGWAWIVDDMTAHLFDEIPVAALLGAIAEGETRG